MNPESTIAACSWKPDLVCPSTDVDSAVSSSPIAISVCGCTPSGGSSPVAARLLVDEA